MQEILGGGLHRTNRGPGGGGIPLEIPKRRAAALDGGHFRETFGEWQGEESHACVKIDHRGVAGGRIESAHHVLDERIDQEAIDLKKRPAANSKSVTCGAILECSRQESWNGFGAEVEETRRDWPSGLDDVQLDVILVRENLEGLEKFGPLRPQDGVVEGHQSLVQ